MVIGSNPIIPTMTAGKTAKTRGCGAINTILLQMFSGKTVVASKSYFGWHNSLVKLSYKGSSPFTPTNGS